MSSSFGKRIEEIYNEIANEDWYVELQEESLRICEALSDNEDVRQLLNHYDEACLKIHSRTEEIMYTKGFRDGINFIKDGS